VKYERLWDNLDSIGKRFKGCR